MAKAHDCLESARYNLDGGYYDAAANRAYYGIFDALTALLLKEGFQAKSHNGARTLFAEHFLKTERFTKEAGIWLTFCFEMRQQSDYDFSSKIEREETVLAVAYCEKFIQLIEEFLRK